MAEPYTGAGRQLAPPPRPVVVLLGVVAAAEELKGVAVDLPLSIRTHFFWIVAL